MRRSLFIAALPASVLIVLAGCVKLPSESLEISRYKLSPTSEATQKTRERIPHALQVSQFSASPEQKSDRMNYRVGQDMMSRYFYHRWSSAPEDMLAEAVAKHLVDIALFESGVYQEDTGVVPSYELRGRLLELHMDDIRNAYAASFSIRVTLLYIDPETYKRILVMQKQYAYKEDMKEASVPEFVATINHVTGQWLTKLTADMESAIAGFDPSKLPLDPESPDSTIQTADPTQAPAGEEMTP
ncbi:hypothetical protein GF324_05690 [bacterium]|nr:hypothetical protein [bacterium]